MKTLKILITGVSGLIGSNFANWLSKHTEHIVFGLDNENGGFTNQLNYKIKYRLDDILSSTVHELFEKEKFDVCYHMAAYASEGRSNYIRKFIHTNNTVGTANIINACINNKCKLIFLSSVAVYSGIPPFDEDTTPIPLDEYALSKYTSEKSIEIAGRVNNLDYSIVRPRNVYGIGQNIFDPSRNVFGIWMFKHLNRMPITIFGDGSHKRSFTYIDDILLPLYNALFFDKQIFNLGASKIYSIKEAATIFCEVTGQTEIRYTENRDEVPQAFCKTEKAEQLLRYYDRTTLYDGIKKMHEWSKKLLMCPLNHPPSLEVKKNLHSSLL